MTHSLSYLNELHQQQLLALTKLQKKSLPPSQSLKEFIDTRLSDTLEYPEYFQSMIDVLEYSDKEDILAAFSAPPQSGKSTLIFSVLAMMSERNQNFQSAYVIYSDEMAIKQRNKYVELCRNAGLDVRLVSNTVVHLDTNSVVIFTSIGGGLTSQTLNGLLIYDDAFSGISEALSAATRETVWNSYISKGITRRSKHLSIVSVGTRWHPDDLTGRIIKKKKAIYINFPAYSGDELTADSILCKRSHTVESLTMALEADETLFNACYMGIPQIVTGEVLKKNPSQISLKTLTGNYEVSYGLDLAYSGKGDWCVLTKLRVYQDKQVIEKTIRRQMYGIDFVKQFVNPEVNNSKGYVYWHGSGQEPVVADLIKKDCPKLRLVNCAGKGKRLRAIESGLIDKWNNDKLHIPTEFMDRNLCGNLQESFEIYTSFTGNKDIVDDDFDSLSSACYGAKLISFNENRNNITDQHYQQRRYTNNLHGLNNIPRLY